jgi:hypothetical protein
MIFVLFRCFRNFCCIAGRAIPIGTLCLLLSLVGTSNAVGQGQRRSDCVDTCGPSERAPISTPPQTREPSRPQQPVREASRGTEVASQCETEFQAWKTAFRLVYRAQGSFEDETAGFRKQQVGHATNRVCSPSGRDKAKEDIASLEKAIEYSIRVLPGDNNDKVIIAGYQYSKCLLEAFLQQCQGSGSSNSATQSLPVNQANQETSTARIMASAAAQEAQQSQDQLDRQRQGKPKTHNPDAVAHQCIDLAQGGMFGGFENKCSFKVAVTSCNFRPVVKQGGFNWSADFDCEKRKFGLYNVAGRDRTAAHNHNTEMVYWFACKMPSLPADVEYIPGVGVRGRCS